MSIIESPNHRFSEIANFEFVSTPLKSMESPVKRPFLRSHALVHRRSENGFGTFSYGEHLTFLQARDRIFIGTRLQAGESRADGTKRFQPFPCLGVLPRPDKPGKRFRPILRATPGCNPALTTGCRKVKPEFRSKRWPLRWVAQATGLCRAATRRSEWGTRANGSARRLPGSTSFPFRPASGRPAQAGRLCYPGQLRNSG